MRKGAKIENEGMTLLVQKGDMILHFKNCANTQNGCVLGLELVPMTGHMAMAAYELKTIGLHKRLGHVSNDIAANTAKYYGWKVTGKPEACESCELAKARQKNLNKDPVERCKNKGERLFLDLSSTEYESYGKSKFWLLVVDDATDYCWSFFLKSKNETAEVMTNFIKKLKDTETITVKNIRYDNAGENKAFEKRVERDRRGLKFEYTARKTPQHNGRVERKYATLFGRARAMMNDAGFVGENVHLRRGLWAEAVGTATKLENIITSPNKSEPAYGTFYGQEAPYARHLRTFGERGVVHDAHTIKNKLDNRGETCIFLGYADNHAGNVYRMFNPRTKRVWTTRDIKWIPSPPSATEKPTKTTHAVETLPDDNDDDDETPPSDHGAPAVTNNTTQTAPTNAGATANVHAAHARVLREMKRLGGWFNPTALGYIARHSKNEPLDPIDEELDEDFDPNDATASGAGREVASASLSHAASEFAFYSAAKAIEKQTNKNGEDHHLVEPKNFREAFDHPDPAQCDKWRAAIHKEFRDMTNRGVWRKVKRSQVPTGRRCIKCKWVLKIKRDGVFRARLVACGYSQIPGLDFSEKHAPVINDVAWRILLIAKIVWNLEAILIDVDTAFLYGDLEEEIYMDLPEGLTSFEDECLLLLKALYGLVQGARQWNKKFIAILKKIGFQGGNADPCLLIKRGPNGIVIVSVYVDDNFCVGHKPALTDFVEDLKKEGLSVKVTEDMNDYLSCNIVFSPDGKSAWIGQPHLIRKLEEKFGDLVKGLQSYTTPGTPGLHIVRPAIVSPEMTARMPQYRSAVGTLLFLLKHSRPDLANPIRELSKVLDCPTEAAFKELKRVIKFVLDTREYGLKIKPTIEDADEAWNITVFSDSDYAGDAETRVSVTGFCVFLLGVPICWQSKGQRSVTLSSSEAEYVALSEAAKEVKFVAQVMMSMGIPVKFPIIVRVDNVGAIFMSENVTTSPRTKHMDIGYHFVREFVEDGFIKIIFVRTKENRADIFTKNTNGPTYEHHSEEFVGTKESVGI